MIPKAKTPAIYAATGVPGCYVQSAGGPVFRARTGGDARLKSGPTDVAHVHKCDDTQQLR